MANRRKLRTRLAEAQNWRCAYCGGVMALERSGPDLATCDHLRPRRRRGETTVENFVCACASCNSLRGDGYAWTFLKTRQQASNTGEWPPCIRPSRAVARRFRSLVLEDHRARAERRRLWRRLTNEGIDKGLVVATDGARYRLRLSRLISLHAGAESSARS